MTERSNVVIQSSVSERPFTYKDRPYTAYDFKALIEGEETAVKFQTTSKEMAGVITNEGVGGKVELEYATTVKGEYTNRKVTQIHKEGTALVAPKSPAGYAKQPYGKHSDKDSEVESTKRTALMQATLLYMHSTDAGVPFNKEAYIKICGVCKKELGLDSPLVEAVKKEGGVEVE